MVTGRAGRDTAGLPRAGNTRCGDDSFRVGRGLRHPGAGSAWLPPLRSALLPVDLGLVASGRSVLTLKQRTLTVQRQFRAVERPSRPLKPAASGPHGLLRVLTMALPHPWQISAARIGTPLSIGHRLLAVVQLGLSVIGGAFSSVGELFALIGDALALISHAVPLVRNPPALVSRPAARGGGATPLAGPRLVGHLAGHP